MLQERQGWGDVEAEDQLWEVGPDSWGLLAVGLEVILHFLEFCRGWWMGSKKWS